MTKSTEIHIERDGDWLLVRVAASMMDTFQQVFLDGALKRGVDVTFIHDVAEPSTAITINNLSTEDYERLVQNVGALPSSGIPMGRA